MNMAWRSKDVICETCDYSARYIGDEVCHCGTPYVITVRRTKPFHEAHPIRWRLRQFGVGFRRMCHARLALLVLALALLAPSAATAQLKSELELDVAAMAVLTDSADVERGFSLTVAHTGLHHLIHPVASLQHIAKDAIVGLGARLTPGSIYVEWLVGRENPHHDDGVWLGILSGGLDFGTVGVLAGWYYTFTEKDDAKLPERFSGGLFLRF